MIIGANPTAAHPVFASRLKKRLRQGAKLIVVDPRRTEMVEVAAYQGAASSAADARHQRRRAHRAGACHRHRGPRRRSLRARALRLERVRGMGRLRRAAEEQPGSHRDHDRRRSEGTARSGAAVRHRRQRRDLLRPRRHRAQPGLDHGDRDRQPRDGDRQYRPSRRRREPAARPEQRAGLLRHGLVPARTAGLSPYLGRCGARAVRGDVERQAQSRAGPAHSQHVRCRDRRHLHGPLRAGRGHPAVRPQHQACGGGAVVDGMRHRPRPLPQRDRELRPRVPAGLDLPREGRHLHQCRTPHPARPQGDGAAQRPCRLGSHASASPRRWATRCTTTIRPRSWTRSRR